MRLPQMKRRPSPKQTKPTIRRCTALPCPIVIAFLVTPRSHNDAPMTDILTETVQEDFVPKVTAITSDACFVTQTAAKVKILHPGR